MELEKELKENTVIVSSTDTTGTILYANRDFEEISEFSKEDLYGKPHNIVRHPDMPRAIFKLIWQRLLDKKTVTAFIKNLTKDKQKFYWVKAVMYPVIENNSIKQIVSYRTKPTKYAIEQIKEVYKLLNENDRGSSLDSSYEFFETYLRERGLNYDQFINRLSENKQVTDKNLLNLDITKFKVDHILFRSAIESAMEKGEKEIEVTSPQQCAFGKQLAALESENFAQDERFFTIKQIHNKIHEEMHTYVHSENSAKNIIAHAVHKDIDKLFHIMNDLIDHYR